MSTLLKHIHSNHNGKSVTPTFEYQNLSKVLSNYNTTQGLCSMEKKLDETDTPTIFHFDFTSRDKMIELFGSENVNCVFSNTGEIVGWHSVGRTFMAISVFHIIPNNTNSNTELIVLSSSDTKDEQVINQLLFDCGVKAVLVINGKVEAIVASLFFEKFYDYLLSGKSKKQAMELTQQYLREETGWCDEEHWKPFELHGDVNSPLNLNKLEQCKTKDVNQKTSLWYYL